MMMPQIQSHRGQEEGAPEVLLGKHPEARATLSFCLVRRSFEMTLAWDYGMPSPATARHLSPGLQKR